MGQANKKIPSRVFIFFRTPNSMVTSSEVGTDISVLQRTMLPQIREMENLRKMRGSFQSLASHPWRLWLVTSGIKAPEQVKSYIVWNLLYQWFLGGKDSGSGPDFVVKSEPKDKDMSDKDSRNKVSKSSHGIDKYSNKSSKKSRRWICFSVLQMF